MCGVNTALNKTDYNLEAIMQDDFDEAELFSEKAVRPQTEPTIIPVEEGNPLSAYFRSPGVTVALPTGGRFLPKGALELNAKGEVEVFPMRGADELLLKSPDALMSGLAVERMIGSCVPALKTPKLISAPDLDVVLLAIRAATHGNLMTMETECPKCKRENAFDINLAEVLATMKPLPDVLELRISDEMVVNFQPHTLDSQTRLLIAAYDQNRHTQILDQEDNGLTDDQKQDIIRQTLDSVERLQFESLANAITVVSVPNHKVTDKEYIIEFLSKAPNNVLTAIRSKIEEINMMGIDRNLKAVCINKKCKHEWLAGIEFNPSTFFGPSSSA